MAELTRLDATAAASDKSRGPGKDGGGERLPVLSYSTGLGWTTLGYARDESQARRVLMRMLDEQALSLVRNFGFELHVFRRTPLQVELGSGPEGFTYCIGKAVRT